MSMFMWEDAYNNDDNESNDRDGILIIIIAMIITVTLYSVQWLQPRGLLAATYNNQALHRDCYEVQNVVLFRTTLPRVGVHSTSFGCNLHPLQFVYNNRSGSVISPSGDLQWSKRLLIRIVYIVLAVAKDI